MKKRWMGWIVALMLLTSMSVACASENTFQFRNFDLKGVTLDQVILRLQQENVMMTQENCADGNIVLKTETDFAGYQNAQGLYYFQNGMFYKGEYIYAFALNNYQTIKDDMIQKLKTVYGPYDSERVVYEQDLGTSSLFQWMGQENTFLELFFPIEMQAGELQFKLLYRSGWVDTVNPNQAELPVSTLDTSGL